MRKSTILLLGLCILLGMTVPEVRGQVITVGDTSCSLTCTSVPVDPYFNYSESQYIIPAGELATAGINTSDVFYTIGWYLCAQDVDAADHDIRVYLSEEADPYPQVCSGPLAAGALVYSGPLGDCVPTGCCSVILATPYTYNGGNLVVTVCDTGVGFSAGSARGWAANADTGNGINFKNDSSGPYDCDPLTNDFSATVACCNSWTTTCFDLTPQAATPTPTETPIPPTNTPAVLGSDCNNPIVVDQSALPFTDNNTNCGLGDVYDATCLGYYDSGEEIIYQIDLTTDEAIMITLDPQGTTYSGFALHDTCPIDSTSCIATVSNTGSGVRVSDCISLTAGTYYLQIDTWSTPDCITNFTLTIETCSFATPTPTPTATATSPAPPGDTCIDAVTIECGDCVLGTTIGAANDHDCTVGHDGPDVVYELVMTEDALVTFIGEADYDADWSIATTCGATVADIGCWDDTGVHADTSCGSITHQSDGFMNHTEALTAGTYYIWVDGYNATTHFGNFALEIFCLTGPTPTPTATSTPCVITCPPGADTESEACGDDDNGGCNADPTSFEAITIGVPMCGTFWSSTTTRDTDWYEVTATDWTEFTMEVIAESDVAFGYAAYKACVEGSGNCDDLVGTLDPFGTSAPCETNSIVVTVPAGTHWFFVAPLNYVTNECTSGQNDYIVTLTSAPGTQPVGYCSVTASREYEYISNVQFNTIDNTTGWDGYGDYTAQSTDIDTGSTYGITITLTDAYNDDMGQVWIDWNGDTDFCDAGEMIPMTVATGLGPYTANITVPHSAIVGNTRMRIGLNYDEMPLICGTALDGDYEDYTVNIVSSGPTPTPEPIPATGPAGLGLMILVISSLIALAGFGRKK